MSLLAPKPVQDSWDGLLKANEILSWNLSEDSSVDADGQYTASEGATDVLRVRRAIDHLYATMRADLDE